MCFFSQKGFWVIESEQFFLAVLCAVKIVPGKSVRSSCTNLRIIKANPACAVRRCLLVHQQAASHCSVITLAPGLSCVTSVTQTNDDLCANVKTTVPGTSSFLIFHTCFARQWGRRKSDRLLRQRGLVIGFLHHFCFWFRDRSVSPFNSGGQQSLKSSRCFLRFVSDSRRKAEFAVSPEVPADVEQAVHVTVLMQRCKVSEHDRS